MKFGIIAIGYNRSSNLERLLRRLNECEYGNDAPMLIVSVDKAEEHSAEPCAREFEWHHGEKVVKTFPERQGLQRHIMRCGSYMEEYDLDAVAVFEDDIVPSKEFYHFMKQSAVFYKDSEEIAGIALYSHRWNSIADRPFCPMDNGYDAYFSHFACSWGQVWMREQWKSFTQWLEDDPEKACASADMPDAVKGWKNSWLKYHIAYCTSEGKYFVYPYKSYATCFAEEGEHTDAGSIKYQVPIAAYSGRDSFCFMDQAGGNAVYDAYFENKALAEDLAKQGFDTCIDFYGLKGKPQKSRYWLSLTRQPYKAVKTYGLCMKPHEENVLCGIEGNEIFLYDTEADEGVRPRNDFSYNRFFYYFNGSIEKKAFLYYLKIAIRSHIHRGRKKS